MNGESERKRLVEVISDTNDLCQVKKAMEKGKRPSCEDCKYEYSFDCHMERIADKLLDDGWMRPPVKVGDKVWDTEGNTWKVFAITIWQDCIGLKVENSRERHIHKTFTIGKHSIGKTVFTSREDAVKALEGKEDEGK